MSLGILALGRETAFSIKRSGRILSSDDIEFLSIRGDDDRREFVAQSKKGIFPDIDVPLLNVNRLPLLRFKVVRTFIPGPTEAFIPVFFNDNEAPVVIILFRFPSAFQPVILAEFPQEGRSVRKTKSV